MFGRNNDGDQAELLARRMEQYEQTLRVMYQRITESLSHRHALGFNYEQLMVSRRTEIGKMIEGLYSGNDNVERATPPHPNTSKYFTRIAENVPKVLSSQCQKKVVTQCYQACALF